LTHCADSGRIYLQFFRHSGGGRILKEMDKSPFQSKESFTPPGNRVDWNQRGFTLSWTHSSKPSYPLPAMTFN